MEECSHPAEVGGFIEYGMRPEMKSFVDGR